MFQPERGRENPVIRRAIELYHQSGVGVIFHPDTVEVRFASNNKRFYPTWSQFLDDAAAIFGDKLPGGSGAGVNLDTEMPGQEAPAPKPSSGPEPASVRAERERLRAEKQKAADEAIAAAEAAEVADIADTQDGSGSDDQVRALKREIKLLKRAIKVVGQQREEWEREALNTREALEAAREDMRKMARNKVAANGSDRYRQLRQAIVRQLHPDAPGEPMEKKIREQLFKMIWTEVEHLDRQ